ncbi:hypothetical protein CVT26_003879 [Gymnopilus dilepis]|uniref:Uncharacterized protein n=1 Tax=Gymnopilus dilepis TaxID=231916 RepID=A0A409WYM0_9AGAR|nr:hypothetical protein CVT26_003879 [Gymnopilus dilepis]
MGSNDTKNVTTAAVIMIMTATADITVITTETTVVVRQFDTTKGGMMTLSAIMDLMTVGIMTAILTTAGILKNQRRQAQEERRGAISESLGIIITIDTVDMKAMTTIPVTGDTDQDTVPTITTTIRHRGEDVRTAEKSETGPSREYSRDESAAISNIDSGHVSSVPPLPPPALGDGEDDMDIESSSESTTLSESQTAKVQATSAADKVPEPAKASEDTNGNGNHNQEPGNTVPRGRSATRVLPDEVVPPLLGAALLVTTIAIDIALALATIADADTAVVDLRPPPDPGLGLVPAINT